MLVFINNTKIVFKEAQPENFVGRDVKPSLDMKATKSKIYFNNLSEGEIMGLFKILTDTKKGQYKKITIYTNDLENIIHKIEKEFKLILAGGGLVVNDKKELLLIFRKGKWDLPKGKLEKGEELDQCALREVEEETGVKVELGKFFGDTYHTYFRNKKHYLKQSRWYCMKSLDDSEMAPQTEEGIEETRWVPISKIKGYLPDSFSAIKWLLKKYLKEAKS